MANPATDLAKSSSRAPPRRDHRGGPWVGWGARPLLDGSEFVKEARWLHSVRSVSGLGGVAPDALRRRTRIVGAGQSEGSRWLRPPRFAFGKAVPPEEGRGVGFPASPSAKLSLSGLNPRLYGVGSARIPVVDRRSAGTSVHHFCELPPSGAARRISSSGGGLRLPPPEGEVVAAGSSRRRGVRFPPPEGEVVSPSRRERRGRYLMQC